MNVSVIIPAHNAADTLAETIESLQAQTYPNWEAIIVDDGSSDETADIITCFMEKDIRIRTVSQPQAGVSAARNSGLRLAYFDWLLFLDADDWLLPQHLERLTSLLKDDPGLDAAYCGWARVTPAGSLVDVQYLVKSGDLFAEFARSCAFAIHTCIVRRSLVEAVGGFNTTLRICEDWDMWQRVARTGARFGVIDEVLAHYRMRPNSASLDGLRLFRDGLRVVTQGHSPDPRMPNAHPKHVNGLPVDRLPNVKLNLACWSAGLMLGCDQNTQPLLDILNDERDPELDPHGVAEILFEAVPLALARSPSAWAELWPTLEQNLDEFLLALEAQAQATELARRTRIILERMVLEQVENPRPLTIGTTHAIRVEVTRPIPDIQPPAWVERLQCELELEGTFTGKLDLPVCDGLVSGYVLADAIAAKFAWPILGRFFERTIYGHLRVERTPEGLAIWRDDLCLDPHIFEGESPFWTQVHDQFGWTIFLQEVWGRPGWSEAMFYEPQAVVETAPRQSIDNSWLMIELSQELPDIESSHPILDIIPAVGGVALGVVTVSTRSNMVQAHELRAALTTAIGFELCRVVVREGLLGQPIAGADSLRNRLATAAANKSKLVNNFATRTTTNLVAENIPEPILVRVLDQAVSSGQNNLVIGQCPGQASGAHSFRRAELPAEAAQVLINAVSLAGRPAIHYPQANGAPERIVYAPDLILPPSRPRPAANNGIEEAGQIQLTDEINDHQTYFEQLFTAQADPWQYTTPYEQTKYQQTLALLPPSKINRALELGCAEGYFTTQLAPHVGHLTAADISATALKRAAKRCADLENVDFAHLDLARDRLPGCFELIVCSELLYYAGDRETLVAVARKLADALEPGGYLLTSHAHVVVDEPDRVGFDWDVPFGAKVISDILTNTSPLRLIKELRVPLYRIQLFQRAADPDRPSSQPTPEIIIEETQPTALPSGVARWVSWYGGSSRRADDLQTAVTDRLPILMYHQVAPTGSPKTVRYRVTPEAFEKQLQYLQAAGFYSITLAEWEQAVAPKKPVPGRAIHLTFDDGYLDFLTYAWPLLKRYGFSATVFLVADEIGRSNRWDQVYETAIPLLGWPEIRQLQAEGAEFGSHTASHPHLTGLSPQEIVYEGVHSRTVLEGELGVPIKAIAYPYGDIDSVVQHLIGACGYTLGLSCEPGLSHFKDNLLKLPRLEVTGHDHLPDLIAKLNPAAY